MSISTLDILQSVRMLDEAAKRNTAHQILSELRNQVPMESFNDDDWYEYVIETGKLIRSYSGKTWNKWNLPEIPVGHAVAKGMAVKHMMLWRSA